MADSQSQFEEAQKLFDSADGALSSANTDLFLPYAFAQSNVATAADISGRRRLHGIFDLPE